MSIVLDYPQETQQLKAIAAEHRLNDLRVFIPAADDIDYPDDTMIVFSDTRHIGFRNVLEFSRRVGGLFRKSVYVSGPTEGIDTTAYLRAQTEAETV